MATIDVYVAFIVGIRCILLHDRPCVPASNLMVWVLDEPLPVHFPHSEWE